MFGMIKTEETTGGAEVVSRETLPILRVPLGQIYDNPYQPRLEYEAISIAGLAANIQKMKADSPATSGLQQIPMARPGRIVNGAFDFLARNELDDIGQVAADIASGEIVVQLCFGHRRNRAFLLLAHGWDAVDPDFTELAPGFETDADYEAMPLLLTFAMDMDMWRHAVAENHHRSNITALEQAKSLQVAIDEFGLNQAEAGESYGWTRSTVANKLRLLDLPEAAQEAILKGELSEKHGRLLLRLTPAPLLLEQAMNTLLEKDMSTRELSDLNEGLIADAPLLPDEPLEVPHPYWDGRTQTIEPPFDYDWFPGPDEMDDEAVNFIVGTCNTCLHKVKFAGEKTYRCAGLSVRSVPTCYNWKERLWERKQRRDQAAAALKAVVEHPEKAGLTSSAQSVSRETVTVDAARQGWETMLFDHTAGEYSRNVTSELLDRGLCGPEKCECFGVYYTSNPNDDLIRPDPENAPNMCCACTSHVRMGHRKKALAELKAKEAGRMTEKERKAQQAATNQEWQSAFDDLLGTADLPATLASTAALRLVAEALDMDKEGTHEELMRRILYDVIRQRCQDWNGDWLADESRTVLQELKPNLLESQNIA